MIKDIIYLAGKKNTGKMCVLVIAMFVGALLEMLGVSMIVTVCSLMVESGSAVMDLLCRWTGLQPGKPAMIALLLGLMVLYLLKMVYLLVENYALERFVRTIQHRVSTELFDGILHGPYEYFTKTSAAEVTNLLNLDTGRMANCIVALLQTVAEGLVMLVISVFLLVVNPVMTLFVFLGIGLSFLLTRVNIRSKAYHAGIVRRKANARRMKWMNQGVRGIKDVKVAQTEDFFCGQYEQADADVSKAEAGSRFLTKVPIICIEAIMLVCILLYMLLLMLTGHELLGFLPSLSALVVATIRLLPTSSRINSYLAQVNSTRPSLEAVSEALREIRARRLNRTDGGCLETELSGSIVAENVTFGYENRPKPVLRGACLEIPVGSSVGIVGASGEGKTTLIDILLGLLNPQEGTVRIDGIPLEECRESYLQKAAYIPQTIFLLDDTIRNNVAFGTPPEKICDEEVWEAIDKAALSDMVRKLPKGLDTQVGESGIRLSGGERQRLGIARALYQKCKLIVFDEATSALDPETEASILRSIRELRGEKTMIIISHRESAVCDCDRIYRVEGENIRLVQGV